MTVSTEFHSGLYRKAFKLSYTVHPSANSVLHCASCKYLEVSRLHL